jgi:hypothetical protein
VKDPLRHRDELYTSPIEEDHTADDNRDCMGHRKEGVKVFRLVGLAPCAMPESGETTDT